MVVARDEIELPRLRELEAPGAAQRRARACAGWTPAGLREIEPHVAGRGRAALADHRDRRLPARWPGRSPRTSRRPAAGCCSARRSTGSAAGVDGVAVRDAAASEHRLDQLVVCAGLQSDRGRAAGRRRRRPGDRAVPRRVLPAAPGARRPGARAGLPGAGPGLPVPRRALHPPGGRRPSTSGRTRCWPPPGRATGAATSCPATWPRRCARPARGGCSASTGGHGHARAARLALQARVRRPGPRVRPGAAAGRRGRPRRPACGPRRSTRTARWSTTSGSAGSARSSPSATRPRPAATSCLAIAEHVLDRLTEQPAASRAAAIRRRRGRSRRRIGMKPVGRSGLVSSSVSSRVPALQVGGPSPTPAASIASRAAQAGGRSPGGERLRSGTLPRKSYQLQSGGAQPVAQVQPGPQVVAAAGWKAR